MIRGGRRKSFLLLELMTAVFVFVTSGMAITRFFSQEIKLRRALSEYQEITSVLSRQRSAISIDLLTRPEDFQMVTDPVVFKDIPTGNPAYACEYSLKSSGLGEGVVECQIDVINIHSKRSLKTLLWLNGGHLKPTGEGDENAPTV